MRQKFRMNPALFRAFVRATSSAVTLLVLALCLTDCAAPSGNASTACAYSALPRATRAANQFTFDLLRQELSQNPGQDLTFSPLSVWSTLTLASAGATGDTQKEMQATLHLPAADPAFYHEAGTLDDHLQASKSIEFHSANRLWVQSNLHLEPAFLHVAQTDFHSGLTGADFQHAAPATVRQINSWVSGQTKGLIQNPLQLSDISSDTRLVLTDAMYFKGDWREPFEKHRTSEAPFYLADGSNTPVHMMHQSTSVLYANRHGIQALLLPYQDGESSMVILLPKRGVPLAQIGARLTASSFQELLTQLRPTSVSLSLPRFTSTLHLSLEKDLSALGMQRPFDSQFAQFDGITRDQPLFISKVIHQSFIRVNEQGTEAAAATIDIHLLGVEISPQTFTADHPFLYVIMDNTSGAILFAGAVERPS